MTWVTGKDAAGQGPHEYLKSEAARKMFNNTTTVSNTYAVWVTVGFFKVDTSATGMVTEGAGVTRQKLMEEVFLNVPGDLRQQYFAVVDRNNLTLDPADTTFKTQGPRPFFTELQDTANAAATSIVVFANNATFSGATPTSLTLFADGQPVTIDPTQPNSPTNATTLYIGTGPIQGNPLGWATNRDKVTVTAITAFDKTTGRATLSVTPATPPLNYHPAGSLVTNAVPGNPGPQPGFDYTSPTYQPVVPYVTRLK